MEIKDLIIERFYPESASDEDFEKAIRIQLESFKENNPADPVPPDHLLRKNLEMIASHPIFNVQIYLAENATGELVGGVFILIAKPESPDYESQKHMGMVLPRVMKEYRRQGIGTQILEFSARILKEQGCTLLQGDTNSDEGRAFANRFGAEVAIESRDNRAYVKDIDWEMVEQWAAEGAKNNPDVTIEFFEGLPEEADLEAYSTLYTEVFNQQPFEELEGLETTWTPERMRELHTRMQEMGNMDYVMFTRETKGDLSGMTEMNYHPERSHRISQGLTGVQENYRGRGLGKWLKAKMLLYMRENFPTVEHIATTNAASNEAMLSINERLGFKLYKHTTMFKIQLDELAKHLNI